MTDADAPLTIAAMFGVTFLGHQGWLFQTKRAAILVDPLLGDAFGHAHALGYSVWPPRMFDFAAFPKLDAVVLSHEHDDHFDLPSLARIDRKVPVWLSARSSTAAHTILTAMGFTVHALRPGIAVTWKDLELVPLAGDHVAVNCGDEWDTLPYLVKQKGGSGSFFSLVDITITPAHVEWCKAQIETPGLLGWTNNAVDWSHMTDYLKAREDATQDCFLRLGVGHKLISEVWGRPAATLFCAGGFAFDEDRQWLNRRIFCVDVQAVCQAMMQIYAGEVFVPTLPGQTFWMQGNRVQSAEDQQPWLRVRAPDTWPLRGHDRTLVAPDFAPATGQRALSSADEARLPGQLQELAEGLVAGTIFRSLHSLRDDELGGRRGTFALVLRTEGEPLVYEYAPTSCSFVRGDANARAAYLAGIECWASDLCAIIRGDLGPIALTYGRASLWNALPTRFHFDFFGDLYRVSHPLRRPAATLRVYERLRESARDVDVVVGPRE